MASPLTSLRIRRQLGQALTEYATIMFGLSLALVAPNPLLGGKSFMEAILQAVQDYWNGFYYVLFLPFP